MDLISRRMVWAAVAIIALLGCLPPIHGMQLTRLDPSFYIEGARVCGYALELESLTLDHRFSLYSYRSSGSPGARAAASWIADVLRGFGLRVEVEGFQFLTWELADESSLTLYVDSQPVRLGSFTPLHLSWPTSEDGVKGEITVYGDEGEVEGRVLIVGVDELALKGEMLNLYEFINAHKPGAVLYTYFHLFNWKMPHLSYSAEGKMYWDIGAPAGWISHDDWMRVKESLKAGKRVEAEIRVPARLGYGSHYNVIGDLEGLNKDRTLIVSAHYDTVMSPGFIDNGAGVSGVLAIAEAFAQADKAGFKPPFNVRFVFFAAEELGLLGSLNYVSKHRAELNQVIGVVNVDSIGGLRLMVVKSSSILDELALEAADELNVPLTGGCRLFSFTKMDGHRGYQTGSDHLSFEDPEVALQLAKAEWRGLRFAIDTNMNVPAITISSRPIFAAYLRTGEKPGWIHTPYDNSTTPGWADEGRLERHVKVSALAVFKALRTALMKGTVNPSSQIFQPSPVEFTQTYLVEWRRERSAPRFSWRT